jgi:hypothetical protein
MTYQELRAEAIKCAINLTDAMLKKDETNIELCSYKLNHFVAELLENIHQTNDLRTKSSKISQNP